MAASYTGKKSDKTIPDITNNQIDNLIGETAKYISNWTQRELRNMSAVSKLPICWPLQSGGFVIGHDKILPKNGYWHRLDRNNEPKQVFSTKHSAIFYCLCSQINNDSLADKIVKYDSEVLRLSNDLTHYETSLNRAIKAKDSIKIDVWAARFDDTKLRLSIADKELKKTIKSAKYLKVWE
jgi:hypothetical protein